MCRVKFLRKKFKVFYKELTKKEDFCASDGWLYKFKRWYEIPLLTATGEKLSCDSEGTEPYMEKFKKELKKWGQVQIEFKIQMKADFVQIVAKTNVCSSANAPGQKILKARVTFMLCSNTSDTHKLELLSDK